MAEQVAQFLKDNPGLEERAVKQLQNADPDIQKKVLERGNLLDCNNPTAVLISRIRTESETSMTGISKADLKGSPEEAWARICAKNNIKVAPQPAGVISPELLALQQQQILAQQQLAAHQSLAHASASASASTSAESKFFASSFSGRPRAAPSSSPPASACNSMSFVMSNLGFLRILTFLTSTSLRG